MCLRNVNVRKRDLGKRSVHTTKLGRVGTTKLGRDFVRSWSKAQSPGFESERSRVLVETPDGAEAYAYWHLLTDNGYNVEWCPGPGGSTHRSCALVASGSCPLVDRADVVVSALGLERRSSREVLEAIRRSRPQTPVVTQAPKPQFERWPEVVGGTEHLRTPVTGPALLRSVADVISDSE
ncbi:MAG TPA: response regulator [Acidimicrobiales bacterium]|nr:response regulator [Acidimicrobiales bacterium]